MTEKSAEYGKGWIGVDLDGTLAEYHGWRGVHHIGPPVPAMLKLVCELLDAGEDVRIFTARVSPVGRACEQRPLSGYAADLSAPLSLLDEIRFAHYAIREWCKEHIGVELPIVCQKDMFMKMLYDDRCRQVVTNTGVIVA